MRRTAGPRSSPATTAPTRQARTASVESLVGPAGEGQDDAAEQRHGDDRGEGPDEHAVGDRRPHVPGARPAAGHEQGDRHDGRGDDGDDADRPRRRWPAGEERGQRGDPRRRGDERSAGDETTVARRGPGHSALSSVAGSSRAVVRTGRSANSAAMITTPPTTASSTSATSGRT